MVTETLREKIKAKFKDWVENTTSHGLPNIADKNKNWIIRIMWLVFFLASLVYCLYVIITTAIRYSKYLTNIQIVITDELPAVFPAVTICNVNAFYESRANEYVAKTTLSESLAQYKCLKIADSAQFKACLNSTDTTDALLGTLVGNLKRNVVNDKSLDTYRSYYGYDLDSEMLVSCLYNDNPCGSVNFSTYWDNEYGNCYTFNDGKTGSITKISKTGSLYGLELEIVVSPPKNTTVYSYKSGLRVMIHNASQVPFTVTTGINIPTGFETYLGVSRTKRTVLDSPYSDCVNELKSFSTYSERLFAYFNDLGIDYYDQDFCYSLCYQDQLIKECSCADTVTPTIAGAEYCIDDETFCMYDFKERFFASNIDSRCENACRQQCERIDYNLVASMATYPTFSYLRFLSNNRFTESYFPKNESELQEFGQDSFLKLIINYDRLYYTEIQDNPDTLFENLLGDLGGQLGLFIGISILSLVEIVELCIELVLVVIASRRGG